MTEDYTSPAIDQEARKSEQAERLLQRQYALQKEAQIVLKELHLVELLSTAGVLRQTGSSAWLGEGIHPEPIHVGTISVQNNRYGIRNSFLVYNRGAIR